MSYFFSIYDHLASQHDYTSNAYGKELPESIISIAKQEGSSVIIKLKKSSIYEQVINRTAFLDKLHEDVHLLERIYCILNSIVEVPKCANESCDNVLHNFKVTRLKDVHKKFCCIHCAQTSVEVISKKSNSLRSRSAEQKLATKLKTESTMQKKFGTKSFMKSAYFKQKTDTYIKRNGGKTNVSQIEKVRYKVIQSNLIKFGCSCNLASEEQKELKKRSCMKHFGAEHHMKSDSFKRKFFEKFAQQHDGIKCAFQLKDVLKKTDDWYFKNRCESVLKNEHAKLLSNVSELEKLSSEKSYWWECSDCGHVFNAKIVSLSDEFITCCPFCDFEKSYQRNMSSVEAEIFKFLKEKFPKLEILRNVRDVIAPKELDIYLPDKKVAIEFNGNFWHSVEFQERYLPEVNNAIFEKTLLCEEKFIHLIHVFEDEWAEKREEVEKLLADVLTGSCKFHEDEAEKIILPRCKFSAKMKIFGYELIEVTQPEIQLRHKVGKNAFYHVHDCGNLVFAGK